jgi:hypothetical protein
MHTSIRQKIVGRNIVVGTSTRCGLEGLGIKSRRGVGGRGVGSDIFRTRPDRPWGAPTLLHNGHRVSFPGVKRTGRVLDHPPHLAPRLKKEYNYNHHPSGHTLPVIGCTLPLPLR